MRWAQSNTAGTCVVRGLRHETIGRTSRVSAEVGGYEVWYESEDALLTLAPEAFAGPFLIPLLARGGKLILEAKVDHVWLENVRRLPAWFQRWWGYPNTFPLEVAGVHQAVAPRALDVAQVAQCFTAGVDSFHTALHGPHAAILLHVNGFDVALEHGRRLAAARRAVEAVAQRLKRRAIFVTTNLRQHPLLAATPWGRTHGGALTAVAQTLRATVGTLVIAASWSFGCDVPCGTHWETDPLWSSSGLQVVHHGADTPRRDKTIALAHEPLAQEHLRVCCAESAEEGNCLACEKCLRTMLWLAIAGGLEHFPGFDRGRRLAERIDGLCRLPRHVWPGWSEAAERIADPQIKRAIRRLLFRTRLPGFWAKLLSRIHGERGRGKRRGAARWISPSRARSAAE